MSRHPLFAETRVALFDAYGTLFNLSGIADPARSLLGERADALAVLWRRKQLEYSWVRTLTGRHGDFWTVTGQALDHALAAFGIEDAALRTRLMEGWLTPRPFPDARPALERLAAAGCRLGVLSNGALPMLTAAFGASGLAPLFEAVLSVEPAGVFKPHPAVYRLGVERFGVDPKAVAFVSSNGWDVAGAAAFGFEPVWVNRDGAPPEGLPTGPRVTVSALSELPALLGA